MCKVVFNIYWLRLCSRPLVIVLTNSWVVVIESVFFGLGTHRFRPSVFSVVVVGFIS